MYGSCWVNFLGVSVRMRMQDYKSLRAAVMICATLVNTQTHTHADSCRLAILGAQPAELS